jgi:hypothetical protein
MAAHRQSVALRLCVRPEQQRKQPAPVSCSVPWPQGALNDTDTLTLCDGQGTAVPAQVRALDRWPDDSIRWLLVNWVAKASADDHGFTLAIDTNGRAEAGTSIRERRYLSTWKGSEALCIDVGCARFIVDKTGSFPLTSAVVSDAEMLASTGLTCTLASPVTIDTLMVIDDGSVSTLVEAEGRVGPLKIVHRFRFHAGMSLVQIETTVLNPQAAEHPGGCWPLGAGGHVRFEDLSVTVLPTERANASLTAEADTSSFSGFSEAKLFQASSGGEQWDSHNHVDAENQLTPVFRGYRLTVDEKPLDGMRATPYARQGSSSQGLAFGSRHFWQNFPKTLEVSRETGIRFGLWPQEADISHELQGGEQKTHEYWLAFGADPNAIEAAVAAEPLSACTTPEWIAASGALPYLTPAAEGEDPRLTKIRDGALSGPQSFANKREVIDEYGWRNFGDLYADHEADYYDGDAPFVSHYNNQYDPLWGCLVRYLTTSDIRWFELAREQANHVRDIDIYHTTADRWPYNHGLFWHTNHYLQAGRASHRAYDPANGTGGGPAAEHLYPSGLKLHYLLTGDVRSRQHVIDFGDYVINSDDGRLQKFWPISSAPTGYMSASGTADYHGPGRGAGNAIVALLEAFDLSRDRRYLTKAEELIRRCCNPHDDLDERDLFNIEKRWYYMVFLHALTRYLDLKRSFGEEDANFDYARQSLLLYVRWAASNEYPYLDKPEVLEFPTETWAAQEMRKSEVFDRASIYASTTERGIFRERAEFFFETSLAQLSASSTAHFTRPTALLLTFGSIRQWFDANGQQLPTLASNEQEYEHPAPAVFVSQREIVLSRLKRGVVLAGILGVLAVGALLL